jgi:hypothetical protein
MLLVRRNTVFKFLKTECTEGIWAYETRSEKFGILHKEEHPYLYKITSIVRVAKCRHCED